MGCLLIHHSEKGRTNGSLITWKNGVFSRGIPFRNIRRNSEVEKVASHSKVRFLSTLFQGNPDWWIMIIWSFINQGDW